MQLLSVATAYEIGEASNTKRHLVWPATVHAVVEASNTIGLQFRRKINSKSHAIMTSVFTKCMADNLHNLGGEGI